MVEQPLYAAPSISEGDKDSEDSEDPDSRNDEIIFWDSEPLEFVDNHFSIPRASEPENPSIQE